MSSVLRRRSIKPSRSSKSVNVSPRRRVTDPTLPARAERILRHEIAFISHRGFARADLDRATREFLELNPQGAGRTRQAPADVPAYFAELYATPLLTFEEEQALFRLMNLFKARANALRADLNREAPSASLVAQIEELLALGGGPASGSSARTCDWWFRLPGGLRMSSARSTSW